MVVRLSPVSSLRPTGVSPRDEPTTLRSLLVSQPLTNALGAPRFFFFPANGLVLPANGVIVPVNGFIVPVNGLYSPG